MVQHKYKLIDKNEPEYSYSKRNGSLDEKPNDGLKVFLCCVLLCILIFYKISGTGDTDPSYRNSSVHLSEQFLHHANVTGEKDRLPVPTNLTYWVDTAHCRMHYVDPFTPEARKIFTPQKFDCLKNDSGSIVRSEFNANTRQYHLHMDMDVAQKYTNSTADDVICCYREILRSGSGSSADNRYKLLPCTNFHEDFVVPRHIDAVIVECNSKPTNKTVQEDAFSFVQYRDSDKNGTTGGGSVRKPGVLLIGIDTLSRINFRRNMPKTFAYLVQKRWFELQGYNKVGDNTFPNLMPLLAGYNETTGYQVCKPKETGGLDNCTFIWDQYKAAGYRTAYAEDTTGMSTFNYIKRGFLKPPTDYYLRPMMLAVQDKFQKKRFGRLDYCIGRRQQGEYIYDYAQQYVNQFNGEPIFGLFWTNSFSHNEYDASSTMDNRMLEYLRAFEKDGVLENSIVIFFSDHGCRWGKLLNLAEGYVEERWPMFFMSLPKWFKDEHPEFVAALEVNRNRLTTPYDVHMTLKHILEIYEPGLNLPQAKDCENCQSIFYEVPADRTCADASIPDHWCTCIPYKTCPKNDATMKKIGGLIIDEMNKYLANKNLSTLCSELKLKSIESALTKIEEDSALNQTTYRVKYVANPKKAGFEATVVYEPKQKLIHLDVESISRLTLYANDSKCIDHKEAKKYCICKDSVS